MDKVDKTLGVALGSGVTANPNADGIGIFSLYLIAVVMNDAHLITN